MGTWSGEPFGNDAAADWAWELEDADDWELVRDALEEAVADDELYADTASIAIAAAEVVAHGLGRATQKDTYTEDVVAFVARAGTPPEDLAELAVAAIEAAAASNSELAELWDESDPADWRASISRLTEALRG